MEPEKLPAVKRLPHRATMDTFALGRDIAKEQDKGRWSMSRMSGASCGTSCLI